MSAATGWGRKAAALYEPAYAKRYRAHDDEFDASGPCRELGEWIAGVCRRFDQPIDVLDLGCGTGRYFWALNGVRDLVGLDASPAMLAEARHPYRADRITAASVTLVEGDLVSRDFEPARFDLVYSIGVLAEHVPLDAALVARVARWLRPSGRFAFGTVHPESASIPSTTARSLARAVLPLTPGPLARSLRERLLSGGMYADERRVHELLARDFAIETLGRFQSEAHLHCLVVARKVTR